MARNSNDLTCRELVELVTEYLENALPATDQARFEAHMNKCKGCRHFVEQIRLTIRLTGKLSQEALNGPALDELLETFRDWKKSRPPSEC